MSIVIENDLKSSQQSAVQLHERLEHEHESAMLRFDLEELVTNVLNVGRKLHDGGQHLRQLALSGQEQLKCENQWAGFNRSAEKIAADVLGMTNEFENAGYHIAGVTDLRKLRDRLHVANRFALDDIRRSMQEAAEGKVTSLDAVRDALRD